MTKKSTKIAGLLIGLGIVCACPFDQTLRAYLHRSFWMPFSKHVDGFARPNVRRVVEAYAGMGQAGIQTPLERLRAAYQPLAQPPTDYSQRRHTPDRFEKARAALVAAQKDASIQGRDREEIQLLDAKIDMREGLPEDPAPLERAKKKFQSFLQTARTPEFRSEARGWLAHVYFVLGDQTGAGKIYLDELNRNGSNLSQETVLTSLSMTYGRDGGQKLRDNLDAYFDTPEHAAFAIQLVTNPRAGGDSGAAATYAKIRNLLDKHAAMLQTNRGANTLALLAMRVALRLGDPGQVQEIAKQVPEDAAVRQDPEFQWMLGGSHFLTGDFAGAEEPLLSLYHSKRATARQKAAAAYGLCGVYAKTGNAMEQLRYALWLRAAQKRETHFDSFEGVLSDMSLYLAISGWDLNLILEFGAPIDMLQRYINENPRDPELRMVQYALAVRLAREEHRYDESAALYASIGSMRRAARMKRMAELHRAVNESPAAKYAFAAYVAENPDRLYFNDMLWGGFQSYAVQADNDSRLTADERQALLAAERKLKDDQEERWRAYQLLREVARESGGQSGLRRKSANLAVQCLRRISDRFGRSDEIRKGDIELSRWLRNPEAAPLP